ncbi:MAG: hypothetical protein P4L11_00185 [Geothrix sp.]|nr:hypothetical protein [Geothrix sp.]
MPYDTELINGGTGILRTWNGDITGKEMIEAGLKNRDLDLNWSLITHFILNLEGVTKFDVSSVDIQQLVEINKNQLDLLIGIRVLAVAAPEDVQFGLVRMYEGYNALPALNIRIFRTMAELWGWLVSSEFVRS